MSYQPENPQPSWEQQPAAGFPQQGHPSPADSGPAEQQQAYDAQQWTDQSQAQSAWQPGSESPQQAYPAGIPQQSAYPAGMQQQGAYPGGVPQQAAYPAGPPQQAAYPGAPMQQAAYPGGMPQQAAYPGGVPQQAAYSGGVPQQAAYSGGVPQPGAYPGGVPQPAAYPGGVPQQGAYPAGPPQQAAYPGGPFTQPAYPGGPFAQPYAGNAAATPTATPPLALWLTAGAGALGVVGSILPWAALTLPFLGKVTQWGIASPLGWFALLLNLAIVVFAVLQITGQRFPGFVTGICGAFSIFLVALGVWQLVVVYTIESDLQRISDSTNKTLGDDPFSIGTTAHATSHASVGPGLWLVVVAGLAAGVALLVGWLTRRRNA